MLRWVPSLRLRLLLAMVTSAVVGLGGAVLLFGQIEHSSERSDDRATALRAARTVAAQVEEGAGVNRLTALQDLLSNDRLTVMRGGATIFEGPPRTGRELEARVQARFPDGVVKLACYS